MDYGSIAEIVASIMFILLSIIISIFLPNYLNAVFINFNPKSVPLTALTIEYEESMIGNITSRITVYTGPNDKTNFRIVTSGFNSNSNDFDVQVGPITEVNFYKEYVKALELALIYTAIQAVAFGVSSYLRSSQAAIDEIDEVEGEEVGDSASRMLNNPQAYSNYINIPQYLKYGGKLYGILLSASLGQKLASTLFGSLEYNPLATINNLEATLKNPVTWETSLSQAAIYTAIGVVSSIATDVLGPASLAVSFLSNFFALSLQTLCQQSSLESHPYYYGYLYNSGSTVIFITPAMNIFFSNNNNINIYFDIFPNGTFDSSSEDTTGILNTVCNNNPESTESCFNNLSCGESCLEFFYSPDYIEELQSLGYSSTGIIYYLTGNATQGKIVYYAKYLYIDKYNGNMYIYTIAENTSNYFTLP